MPRAISLASGNADFDLATFMELDSDRFVGGLCHVKTRFKFLKLELIVYRVEHQVIRNRLAICVAAH